MNKEFETEDLNLAAALDTMGVKIVKFEHSSGNRFKFVFDGSKEVSKMVDDYWNGSLLIDARKFALNLRSLKYRIHSNDSSNL